MDPFYIRLVVHSTVSIQCSAVHFELDIYHTEAIFLSWKMEPVAISGFSTLLELRHNVRYQLWILNLDCAGLSPESIILSLTFWRSDYYVKRYISILISF